MDASLLCGCCKEPLVMIRTEFRYLGHFFYEEVPCCPACGQVYISRDLAEGKMREVEQLMEEK